ncbi:MAG: zinc ribbon domain-containing protein [Actinomycetota bacterium]
MIRAAREDQRQLLELQRLDSRLARLAHERRTLPVLHEIRSLQTQAEDTENERIRAATLLGDLRRELTRVEDDVEQIRQRSARYQARAQGAGVSAKDAAAMQQEIALLADRTAVLEDAELEQMETVETAEKAVAALLEQAAVKSNILVFMII